MRLLTAALLSLMLTACGQSGALYFAKPDNAAPEKQAPVRQQPAADASADDSVDAPTKSADQDSSENSDATTGP